MAGRRDFENRDPALLRQFLQASVILVDGGAESIINVRDRDPVFVSIVVDVDGHGPHQGAIYAHQNRFHANADTAMEAAFELLEEWIREHYHPNDPDDSFTETFDAAGWKLSAADFADAIEGTDAAKFIEVMDA